MSDLKKLLGSHFRSRRESFGMSIACLASHVETDAETIAKIENGKIEIPMNLLVKLVKTLKLEPIEVVQFLVQIEARLRGK